MSEAISPSGRGAIPVSHGQLEVILREPAEPPVAVAVVCHPHPRGGGTMNNNVVYRLAKALVEGGVAALRFNFRGVGASTGSYAHGIGEEEDARAALDFLQARYPTLPIWMAGFSFGARVGLSVGARDARVTKLLGVGLALQMFDYGFLGDCPKPKALIQASNDEYGARPAIEAAVATMAEPKRLWIVEGATHLFPGQLDPFEAAAREAVTYLGGQSPPQ
jgi:alpha/beta superfamily hydrolase